MTLLWIVAVLVIIYNPNYTSAAQSDELEEWVNRTELVARVVNGVALQSGLMARTMTVDDAIGELLHFGNVSLSQAASFNGDKITTLASQLTSVSLDTSTETLEEQMLKLNEIRNDSKALGTTKTFPDTSTYYSTVEKFKNEFDFTSLQTGKNVFVAVVESFKKINETDETKALKTQDVADMEALADNLDKAAAALETIGKVPQENFEMEALKPIELMIELIVSRNAITASFSSQDVMKTNFEAIAKLAGAANDARTDFELMKDLIAARVHPQKLPRKYTQGMPNGISDMVLLNKDVADSWLAEMMNSTELDSKLANGFKPLSSIQSELGQLDGKLKVISTQDIQRSVEAIYQLNIQTDGLGTILQDATDVIGKFDGCTSTVSKVPESFITTIKVHIGKIKKLSDVVQTFKTFVEDTSSLKTDIESLSTTLNEVNTISSADDQKRRVAEIMAELKSSGNLTKLTDECKKVQENFGVLLNQTAQQVATDVFDKQAELESFKTDNRIKDEFTLHACLQETDEKAGKVAEAIVVAKKLRKMNVADVTNFGTAASTISQVSKNLGQLKSLPDIMHRAATVKTKQLNAMKDSSKHAVTIGRSAVALRTMFQFSKMETSHLDTEKALVAQKIAGLPDSPRKSEMESIWNRHSDGITSMKKQLQSIQSVASNVKQSKSEDLKSYGEHLKQFTSVQSVSLNAEKELEVVRDLVKTDPGLKDRLSEMTTELENLAPLDLDFASYHTDFNVAPLAFTSFGSFLDGFLSDDGIEATTARSDKSMLIWIIVGVGAAFFLGILILGFWFCIYPYMKTPSEKDIVKWISRQAFKSIEIAEKYHQKIFTDMSDESRVDSKASLAYLPLSKMRYSKIYCNPDTAVKVTRDGKPVPIHANKFVTRGGCTFIATQAPMDGKEKGKDNTLEDFLDMIVQQESEFVVMLCKTDDGVTKVPEYIPGKGKSLEIGRYKLTNEFQWPLFSYEAMKATVLIEDKTGKYRPRKITHIQFNEWPDNYIPIMPHTAVGIMQLVNKSKKPIVVHCTSGVGRTVSFIAIEAISNDVVSQSQTDFRKALKRLKAFRWHSLQSWQQSYYVQICVIYKICLDQEFENLDDYQQQYLMQRKMIDDKDAEDTKKSKVSVKAGTPTTPNTARTPSTPTTQTVKSARKTEKSTTESGTRSGGGKEVVIEMNDN